MVAETTWIYGTYRSGEDPLYKGEQMKPPKLLLKPFRKTKKEKTKEEMFQKLLDYEWERKGDLILAISNARFYVKQVCGHDTPDNIWYSILEEICKLEAKK